jgi:hypothetical protein
VLSRSSKRAFVALRTTITFRWRAEDDEQFHEEAEPSIVLNEVGLDGRERQHADAESGSEGPPQLASAVAGRGERDPR